MKRLTFAVIAAALLWSGWWVYSASALRSDTEDWFEAVRSEGWTAEYADLSLRGFPNRQDLTLTDLVLTAPDGAEWRAPFFQTFQLVYQPGHQIFVWPDRQSLTTASGAYDVTSEGLRASLVRDGALVQRANLEAPVLNIAGPDRSVALAGVNAGLAVVPGLEATYRLGLSADAIAGSSADLLPAPDQIDGLAVQAEITLDRPLDAQGLVAERPQPTRIDLRLAEYKLEGLELKLAGVLDIDDAGQATGDLTLRAVNWREALASAREAGALPGGLVSTLEQAFGMLSQLNGNGQTLDITLKLRQGAASVGLIPLGQAPLFRLP